MSFWQSHNSRCCKPYGNPSTLASAQQQDIFKKVSDFRFSKLLEKIAIVAMYIIFKVCSPIKPPYNEVKHLPKLDNCVLLNCMLKCLEMEYEVRHINCLKSFGRFMRMVNSIYNFFNLLSPPMNMGNLVNILQANKLSSSRLYNQMFNLSNPCGNWFNFL